MIGVSLRSHPRRRNDYVVPQVSAIFDFGLAYANGSTLTIPDRLSTNAAVQATSGRKPTIGVAANGKPIATFLRSAPNQLAVPVVPAINGTTKWGFACWVKMVTNGSFHCLYNRGRAGEYSVEIYLDSNRRCRVSKFGQDSSGYNGRDSLTAVNSLPAAGTFFALRYQFDGSGGSEAARDKTFVDGVDLSPGTTWSNVGAGGSPVALRSTTGSCMLGNYVDSTDATYAADVVIGSRIWYFSDSPIAADCQRMMDPWRPT